MKVAIVYEINVATAEPIIPYKGMKIKFKMTFSIIPINVRIKESLVRFSFIKYWLLATPKKTATPAQM